MGAKGYQGLAIGKRATFIIASGGNYSPGAPAEKYNMETPYLQGVFGFIGITDSQAIHAGDTASILQGKVSMEELVGRYVEQVKAAA